MKCVLWRKINRDKELNTYELDVVFFGFVSDLSLAQETKSKNAKRFEDQYPEAVNAILRQYHYIMGRNYLGNVDII